MKGGGGGKTPAAPFAILGLRDQPGSETMSDAQALIVLTVRRANEPAQTQMCHLVYDNGQPFAEPMPATVGVQGPIFVRVRLEPYLIQPHPNPAGRLAHQYGVVIELP